ncbi:hypothetical protein ACEPPN_019237 [Leptodophora sp. 'Broadleaf-Isolate-01']
MAVSFSFNAGPLAQIGFNVLSLDTAYHLAVGAYGWYKARERSQSLKEVWKIAGGELISTSSFDKEQYSLAISRHSMVQGIVIQEGQLLPTSLPKASTALPEDPGLTCLRALVTGLLCFYDVEASLAILEAVIPTTLIQRNPEDRQFAITGPGVSALRDYLNAVAVEEDNNVFRKYLLDNVGKLQSTLTGAAQASIQTCEPVHSNDMHLTIGALKWMMLPVQNRASLRYATRSLRVWSVAAAMHILGFEVSASSRAVNSHAEYASFASNTRLGDGAFASIVLVTGNYGETDQMQEFNHRAAGYAGLRPQIMPVRGIPWSAFRHMSGSSSKVNTQYLVDVWSYSFAEAKASVHPPTFNSFGFARMETTDKAQKVVFELHRNLLRIYSPELQGICGKAMQMFVPQSTNSSSWDPDAMSAWLDALELNQNAERPVDIELADNTLIMTAIILGTIYGVISKCCFDGSNEMNEYTEIVFRPDLLFEQDRLRGWAVAVGRVIGSVIRYEDWNGCVYEAVLAKDFGMFHGAAVTAGRQFSKDFTVDTLSGGKTFVGGQSNGMSAISKMAIEPTLRVESMMHFCLRRGQILTLPLTDDQFIKCARWKDPWTELQPGCTTSLESLDSAALHVPDVDTRVDLEPCWESDPTCVILKIRRKGIAIASVNLGNIVHSLTVDVINCDCKMPSDQVTDFTHNGWEHLLADKLMGNSLRRHASTLRSLSVIGGGTETKILLDGRRSSAMALYCIGISGITNKSVGSGCFRCINRHIEKNPNKTLIIIVT